MKHTTTYADVYTDDAMFAAADFLADMFDDADMDGMDLDAMLMDVADAEYGGSADALWESIAPDLLDMYDRDAYAAEQAADWAATLAELL